MAEPKALANVVLEAWQKNAVTQDITSEEKDIVFHCVLVATGYSLCEGRSHDGQRITQPEADTFLRRLEELSWTRLIRVTLEAAVMTVDHVLETSPISSVIRSPLSPSCDESVTMTLFLVTRSVAQRNWRRGRRVDTWNGSCWEEHPTANTQDRCFRQRWSLSSTQPDDKSSDVTDRTRLASDEKNKELVKQRIVQILTSLATADGRGHHESYILRCISDIAQIVRRLCRYEFPHRWPELLGALGSLTQSSPSNQQLQFPVFPAPGSPINIAGFVQVVTLYYIVKEQASKRLPVAIAESCSLGPELLDLTWPWWLWVDTLDHVSAAADAPPLMNPPQRSNYNAFRYIEKTVLLISCYFFRAPHSSLSPGRHAQAARLNDSDSVRSRGVTTTARLPRHVLRGILHRTYRLTKQFGDDICSGSPSRRNEIHHIIPRLNSMWKLLWPLGERQHITLGMPELNDLIHGVLDVLCNLRPHLKCEGLVDHNAKWIAMWFRFLNSLVAAEVQQQLPVFTDTNYATEVRKNAEMRASTLPAASLKLLSILPEEADVWKLVEFGLDAAASMATPVAISTWLSSSSGVEDLGELYLKGNDEIFSAIQMLLVTMLQSCYGSMVHQLLTRRTQDIVERLYRDISDMSGASSQEEQKAFDGLETVLHSLSTTVLVYLMVMSAWSDNSSNSASHGPTTSLVPPWLYQETAIQLLGPATLDVFLALQKCRAVLTQRYDGKQTEDHQSTTSHTVLYFLYVARCLSFIKNWSEAVSNGCIPLEGKPEDMNVGTVVPILLVWSSLKQIPSCVRLLAISASVAAFDAFHDHPVWWLGVSQLPLTVKNSITMQSAFAPIIQHGAADHNAISDLFLAAAVDVLSLTTTPEGASECLTLTLKLLAATVEPTVDDEGGARGEGRSSLMSVTSDDEDVDLNLHTRHYPRLRLQNHQDRREALLIHIIQRTWCVAPITTITPIHSIVLDNLVFLIIMQWRRYQASPTAATLSGNALRRNMSAQPPHLCISAEAISSARCAMHIFNSAFEACLANNATVWLPYWCKIGNVVNELLRLFLVPPCSITFHLVHRIIQNESTKGTTAVSPNSVAEDTSVTLTAPDAFVSYLALCSTVAVTFQRVFKWITALSREQKIFQTQKLLDSQMWEICFEYVYLLIQANLIRRRQQPEARSLEASSDGNTARCQIPTLSLVEIVDPEHEASYTELGISLAVLQTFREDTLPLLLDMIAAMLTASVTPTTANTLDDLATCRHEQHNPSTPPRPHPSSSLSSSGDAIDIPSLSFQLLFHLTLLPHGHQRFDEFLQMVLVEVLHEVLAQHNVLATIAVAAGIEGTTNTAGMSSHHTTWDVTGGWGKSAAMQLIAAALIHHPIVIRHSLDQLLTTLFPETVHYHSGDAIKTSLFGVGLLLLEAFDAHAETIKASVAAALVEHVLSQVPLGSSSEQSRLQVVWADACVGLIVLLFRYIAEIKESTNSQHRPSVSVRPYSPSTAHILNSSLRRSGASTFASGYGKFGLDLQFRSQNWCDSPQSFLKKQPLTKSIRCRVNEDLCLTLPRDALIDDDDKGGTNVSDDEATSQQPQFLRQNCSAYDRHTGACSETSQATYLRSLLQALSSWITLLQQEHVVIVDRVSQLISADNKELAGKSIPTYRTLFGGEKLSHRPSIQSEVFDEIDMDTAQKGVRLFQEYCSHFPVT